MAVYDLEEQEQLDELKSWWDEYGRLVLWVVVAILVAISAFLGWRYYQQRQALEAGQLYAQVQSAATAQDQKKVRDIATILAEKYPRTTYASFAALAAAKAAFDTGDAAGAKAQLQWVVENARNDEIRDIARLRLAAVLLDEKNYDEALKLLSAQHADTLSARFADLKGDVLMGQGKMDEARNAYQLALDKTDAGSPYRALIQLKADALGAAK